MKYALVAISVDQKENKRHFNWISLFNSNSREDDIFIVKQEISYLKDEIKSLQSVNKLLSRRKTELKNFENLLRLLENDLKK